ncbi:nucleotide exchange factor SIL1 [Apiospora rasikravindrae]|uniref:Nucleotide exchange factor SIL1 n=1 Tax=Apiospora rasikravindrae TaxID=990691 RepID=A0ABR1UDS9_9PEZI
MASSRMRSIIHLSIAFLLLSFVVSSIATVSSPVPASSSPAAEGELICHTDNSAECYPKVFSPTDEFQIVHDDQDLPSGLHVRMNIWTGQKEAKINTPGAEDAALEGLPVDQAVMVVDPDLTEAKPNIPSGAPVYEPVGVVKEPKEKNPGFFQALDSVKLHRNAAFSAESSVLEDALAELEDFSHDMYYGQQIAGDEDILRALFHLVTKRDAEEVTKRSSDGQSLKDAFYGQLKPRAEQGSADASNEATWMRALLAVVGKLLKSDKIRDEFLDNKGMEDFLRILMTKGSEWEPARAKVARIVMDNFLDENVGAKTGVWPPRFSTQVYVCDTEGREFDDSCWVLYLGRIIKDRTQEAWAQELYSMLQPGGGKIPPNHNEL